MTNRIASYRKRFLEEWFDVNPWGLFFFICLVYITLLLLKRVFIIDSIAAFEVLNERGEIWVFDILYGIQYLSVPIFLVWKFTWTALILWIGSFMFGYRLHFNQLWRLVMLLEVFFFIPEVVKILWFTLLYSDPNYFDYLAFYPLSLMNLVNHETIGTKFHYPLKALNLFEVAYWLLLMIGIYVLSGKKWRISIYIVASTYILFFLIWLIFYLAVY